MDILNKYRELIQKINSISDDESLRKEVKNFESLLSEKVMHISYEKGAVESVINFEKIIDQIRDGIIVFDKIGNIIIWNSGASLITGVKSDKVIGQRLPDIQYEILHGKFKNRELIEMKFSEVVSMNNPEVYFENDIYTEISGVRTIQACVFPIFIVPDNRLFGTVIRDITELKQIENQLRTLNETNRKMFSIIAHDLRSPFTSIIGFSELPLEFIEAYKPEKIKQIFEHINLSAKPTLYLIDNLLDWAKSQTGQMSCHPERFMLKPVLNDVIKLYHLLAEIKNLSLNYFISTDIEIYADLNQFKSILRNLISNAIKFTGKNGSVDIFADQYSDNIEITVMDNGVGMTKEIMSKIFNNTTYYFTNGTEGEKGSGLGLTICKEFVENNGGRIWVESEVNKGSKFKFSIPLKMVNM